MGGLYAPMVTELEKFSSHTLGGVLIPTTGFSPTTSNVTTPNGPTVALNTMVFMRIPPIFIPRNLT